MSDAAPDDPVEIDLDRVREVAKGCGWTLAELAAFYQPRAAAEVVDIREALAAGDVAAVARLTHGAAGSSSTLGIESMTARFRQISEDASRLSAARLDEMIEDVERHMEKVLARIAELARGET